MQNGSGVKCSAETVYCSDREFLIRGLETDSGYPYPNIQKETRWIPDILYFQMRSFVYQTCGYFEMFGRELNISKKLNDCDNWKKIEANQAFVLTARNDRKSGGSGQFAKQIL